MAQGLGANEEKTDTVPPIAQIQGIHGFHQAFRALAEPCCSSREPCAVCLAYIHQARLLVGIARAIDLDFLQAKQGGAHQQARVGAGVRQGNDQAVAVLRILLTEGIGVDEYINGMAYPVLAAQFLGSMTCMACQRLAQIGEGFHPAA